MHLEVEVVGGPLGVTRVADEADHLARFDTAAVLRSGRVRGEMRVVELVPLAVPQPQAVATGVVPADREDGSVCTGEHRCPKGREDVVAVVPVSGHVAAEGAERVREIVRPVDREDVAARGQLGLQPERDPERRPKALGLAGLLRRRLGLLLRRGPLARSGRGHRRRRSGLSPGLGVADEDLASGGEPAVIGRQVDVEAGDVAAVALSLAGRGVNLGLLEGDRVAPVAERDTPIGARRLRDAADRKPGDGSAREASGHGLPTRRRVRVTGDVRRGHLTAEERERADRARSDGSRIRTDIRRGRDRDRAGRQDGAVTRIGEPRREADRVGWRRDGGRHCPGLVRNDHLHPVGARRRTGLRAV